MPLHPQAKQFLDDLASLNPPAWEELTPDEGRKRFASLTDLFGPGEPVADVVDRQLGEVGLRIYTPTGPPPLPVIVYFHGGGWVLGDRDTHDPLCRRLANQSQCVVVSVDYRRAPECRFPGPLDDCYSVVRHIAENPQGYQADAQRIAVAGDSAGGNLAAAVALKSRDEDGPAIALQLLIYPVIAPKFDTRSYTELAEGYGLSRSNMQWFWRQYLRDDGDAENAYAAPLAARDLSNLPPAHVITAKYDVLRDEGQAFAQRLSEAGVRVTTRHYDDMLHGFMHFSGIFDVGRQGIDDAAAIAHQALGG